MEKEENTIDLSWCGDVFAGNIRLFKLIFDNGPVTSRNVKEFAAVMGKQLLEKYSIELNQLDVRFAYEKELIKRINGII